MQLLVKARLHGFSGAEKHGADNEQKSDPQDLRNGL